MRRLATLAFVIAVAIVAAALAFAAQSPHALRAAILAAGRAQTAVHWVQKARDPGSQLTLTSDVSKHVGTQKLTLKAGNHTAHLTIKLLVDTAYVEGDVPGLVVLQGLTPTQAQKYANQWISVPKDDKDFSHMAAGLTVSSILEGLIPGTHLTSVSRKRHGKQVVGVRAVSGKGKKKVIFVLYAPATGKPLPLELDESAPAHAGVSDKTTFSKWNESLTVNAPDSSTPITTVRKS